MSKPWPPERLQLLAELRAARVPMKTIGSMMGRTAKTLENVVTKYRLPVYKPGGESDTAVLALRVVSSPRVRFVSVLSMPHRMERLADERHRSDYVHISRRLAARHGQTRRQRSRHVHPHRAGLDG